jgi:hypothetical protein
MATLGAHTTGIIQKKKMFSSQSLTIEKKVLVVLVQLISKLSSTPQKSRSRFIRVSSRCEDAFLKCTRHIFI